MPAREHILHRVRTALGRSAGQPPAEPPPVWLDAPAWDAAERVRRMLERFPGQAVHAAGPEHAGEYIAAMVRGRRAVVSPASLLERLGILALPEVTPLGGGVDQVRALCATADLGITSAEYGLADTGALVVLASREESRLASLLPPVHLAVLEASRILTSLDEMFTVLPDPSQLSSSVVLIGGPSKTADIEQILTLGVHGPRELHLVLV